MKLSGLLALAMLVALGTGVTEALAASDHLLSSNNTPFPTSSLIVGASWATARYAPPSNQFGDILATTSFDGGALYTLINDGGTDTNQPAMWRNSIARVTGSPGQLKFTPVGDAGPALTYAQVHADENLLGGPLGSYYANGLTAVEDVLYATQVSNWDWNANAPFTGLAGIAYSTDRGENWVSPKKPFPGPTGNLNFIQYGDDDAGPGGYVYAIATEREFNASHLYLGRVRASPVAVSDPAQWHWADGGRWTSSISRAQPVLTWKDHITYPRMSYDAALHRYLLTLTYSYSDTPPGIWKNGSELVILESASPGGPFSFVARQPYFGPSNGYDPAFPINWMQPGGRSLWMIWAANFDKCAAGLDCSGAYGFNYRELRLTLASDTATAPAHHRRRHPRRGPQLYIQPPRAGRPRGSVEAPEPE